MTQCNVGSQVDIMFTDDVSAFDARPSAGIILNYDPRLCKTKKKKTLVSH